MLKKTKKETVNMELALNKLQKDIGLRNVTVDENTLMIQPNKVLRTDGFNVDSILTPELKETHEGLYSRIEAIADFTPKLYDTLKANPTSISNWFPQLNEAVKKSLTFFKTPQTKILTLPIEFAQFTRLEYANINQISKDFFNDFIFKQFELEEDKSYFIKTGTYSDKFTFHNAHCKEPLEMGDYFIVINNTAMLLGASRSVDLCVREYIEPPENTPVIYSGMPLRTEFRAFFDFDKQELIGVVPYWNPLVMKRALAMGRSQEDYNVYLKHEDSLTESYNKHLYTVKREITKICKNFTSSFKGQYSVDVMLSGEDFYVIDMALMEESALTELL